MRSKEEIQSEYMRTCAALGDVQYRMSCFQEEADKLQARLHNLNVEEQKRAKKQGEEVALPAESSSEQPGTEVAEAAHE